MTEQVEIIYDWMIRNGKTLKPSKVCNLCKQSDVDFSGHNNVCVWCYPKYVKLSKAEKRNSEGKMMSIKVGSKWAKNNEAVTIENAKDNYFDNGNTSKIDCIWFWDKDGYLHVLTESDFLKQYKPYEPVYEYKYAFIDYRGEAVVSLIYFINEKDFKNRIGNSVQFLQRLDFTKRERT